jgi:hypothetical protein
MEMNAYVDSRKKATAACLKNYPSTLLENLRKTTESSAKMAGFQAKNGNWNLHNSKQDL